jgi:hypothetical protein
MLLMVLTVADSTVVKIASAGPVSSRSALALALPGSAVGDGVTLPDRPSSQIDGPPMTDGRVDWYLDVPRGDVKDVSALPNAGETAGAYFYDTPFGNFTFPRSAPHRLRLLGATGVAVDAAWFDVDIPFSVEGKSEVFFRDATTFTSGHGLVVDGTKVAEIRTTYEFFADRSPKISAILTPLVKLKPTELVWTVLTNDSAAEFGETKIPDLWNVTDLVLVDGSDSRIDIGTVGMFKGEQPRMSINWSDAPMGTLTFAGRIPSRLGYHGGVVSYFPVGLKEIDPTVFAASTSSVATGYSSQRKVIWDGERYWVFYDAGGAAGVAYRATPDGVTWTPSRSSGTGSLSKGFDVESRGPTIGLAWYSGLTLTFRKGSFYGDIIAWGPIQSISTAAADPPLPSVTIAGDGAYWVSGHKVYRSTDGVTWADKTTPTWTSWIGGTAATFVLSLSGMQGSTSLNGWVYAIIDRQGPTPPPPGFQQLLLGLYNVSSGSWTEHSYQLLHQPNLPRYDDVSAVAVGPTVYLLYTNVLDQSSSGELYLGVAYLVGSSFDFALNADLLVASNEFAPYYPSITVGPPGYLYAFWRAKPGTEWVIRNSTYRGGPFVWMPPSSQFTVTPGQNPTWLSAPRSLTNRAVVVYRDAAGSCSTCNLKFGAIPLVDDFGASAAHPWARAGLAVGAPLIGEMSDAVNAATGKLLVKQTDARASGRGLDLSLAHVHTSPYAFQSGSPMFYETNPTVPMGIGWEMGIPWISDTYLHLGDGQRYVIVWNNGSKFENRGGTPFTLYNHVGYPCLGGDDLYLADGTRLNFTLSSSCTWFKLNYILDGTGQNQISFTYSADKLTNISDTLGRTATFTYYASGTYAGRLQTISYAGRSVTFDYTTGPNGGIVLWHVTYPLNLRTTYAYTTSDYLIGSVTQPWGASTSYTYASAPVGTEATGYYITRQDIKDNGAAVRSRTFNYALVNGWSTSTNISLGDGSVTKGYQVLGFASASRGMMTLVKDATGKQLSKTVAWYTPTGSLGATDAYLGDAANRNYTNVVAMDSWGNPYYSLTALTSTASHETFASYGNADSQNAFRAPATLRMTTDGKVQAETFERLDLTPWTLIPSTGAVSLNYTVWNHNPPSMRISLSSGSTATAQRSFPAQSGAFLFTTSVRLNETNKDHKMFLEQGSTTRAELTFAADGNVKWMGQGGAYVTLQPYAKDTWYRVSLELDMAANTAVIAVNENRSAAQTIYQAGTVDRVRYLLGSAPEAMFVGDYSIARKNPGGSDPYLSFRVTGLVTGRKVEFFDLTDVAVWSGTADGSGNADVTGLHHVMPAGYVKVYDAAGKEEYRSPFREFWPGSSYAYGASYTYPNGKFYANTLPADVHSALLGTLQWQTGRGASTPIVEESYAKYLANGLLNATKVYHNAVPLETTYSRDAYGNLILKKPSKARSSGTTTVRNT